MKIKQDVTYKSDASIGKHKIHSPGSVSSAFVERSHIRETLDIDMGICRGFFSSILILTSSAQG